MKKPKNKLTSIAAQLLQPRNYTKDDKVNEKKLKEFLRRKAIEIKEISKEISE